MAGISTDRMRAEVRKLLAEVDLKSTSVGSLHARVCHGRTYLTHFMSQVPVSGLVVWKLQIVDMTRPTQGRGQT